MSDQLSRKQLATFIHEALRAWHRPDAAGALLPDELLLVRQRGRESGAGGSPEEVSQTTKAPQTTKALVREALAALAARDEQAADLLRQRFMEEETLYSVGQALNVSQDTVSRRQRAALAAAADLLWEMEQAAREERRAQIEALLPPPAYSRLFGLAEAQAALLQRLGPSQAPWVLAVTGIGGIGKTALADAVTRQLVQQVSFDDVLWLRVQAGDEAAAGLFERLIDEMAERLMGDYAADTFERRLMQVRQRLAAAPYLVVIDNLEAQEGLPELVAHLNELADPGKFLLTTRIRPQGSVVFTYSLDELEAEDAAALLKHHAEEVGIGFVAQATSQDFEDIYEVTGGNPLALKLVVSLMDVLPLGQIVAGLQASRPGPIEALYLHIYWQSWRTLGENARRLLKAMPLVAETGATLEYLQTLSALQDEQLWPALHELRRRSLLEVRGTLHEKRYGIHRLTDTFLRTEIVHWPEEGNWER